MRTEEAPVRIYIEGEVERVKTSLPVEGKRC